MIDWFIDWLSNDYLPPKRLEAAEPDSRIGQVAKRFNAQHLVKAAMKVSFIHIDRSIYLSIHLSMQEPDSVSIEQNSAMDLLQFTPEELVCLLKNFDTLSAEERKERTNSLVEQNIDLLIDWSILIYVSFIYLKDWLIDLFIPAWLTEEDFPCYSLFLNV